MIGLLKDLIGPLKDLIDFLKDSIGFPYDFMGSLDSICFLKGLITLHRRISSDP